ncbi:fumarate hydratase [Serpentinicella alkaliphila]|nr:fumarate hydratase [Serpentinicella alkaliphila]QUH27232.1 fumarate hydratase [Serpentinicella alkaliphila]
MKTIDCKEIVDAVKKLCIQININMPNDVKEALVNSINDEDSMIGRRILEDILLNGQIASRKEIPMCQDTGMIVVFVEIGQDVKIINGSLSEAINEGVRLGYREGFLRKSVVKCPIRRGNTEDNTPAVIHFDIVPGNSLKIHLGAKGFGSENMSAVKMLKPSDEVKGIKDFVIETIKNAGGNPCPPIIVGVGIGGTFDKVTMLAKKALLKDLGQRHEDSYIGDLELELLKEINELGIGPQGFGGKTTALDLHIETFPTHIAGLPVAVNINCHASRHGEIIL